MMEFEPSQTTAAAASGAATAAVVTAPAGLPAGATAIQTGPGTYEYHLPHTKAIDLIGAHCVEYFFYVASVGEI